MKTQITPWSIRRAGPSESETLAQLRIQFLQEFGDVGAVSVKNAIEQYMSEKLATSQFIAWVAEADDQIVATSGLILVDKPPTSRNPSGREGYIMNMYTLPNWRGQGIATAILERIVVFVKETDARCVRLHATAAGRPIYEKAGFVKVEAEMALTW